MSGAIEIRKLNSIDEFRRCEELQKEIWGMSDLDAVPYHLLIAVQNAGGLVLGAFDGERMVGFAFTFPAVKGQRPAYYFAMLGVLPSYQRKGIGYRLSLSQREYALSRGVDLMVWTFDPLQSVNAHLYLAKLGVLCEEYFENFYGEMRNGLNVGVPSDRLLAEWWLKSPRVLRRLRGERGPSLDELLGAGAELVVRTELRGDLVEPTSFDLAIQARTLLVEIPPNFNALKAADLDLARRWRSVTRRVFKGYLDRGYLVSDFVSELREGRRRSFYVLSRASRDEILGR